MSSHTINALIILNPIISLFSIYRIEKDNFNPEEKRIRIIVAVVVDLSAIVTTYFLYRLFM